MRPARNDVVWSRGRAIRRAGYEAYMRSPQWFARRRRWLGEWRARHNGAPTCRVCGRLWSLGSGDLHHATYERLGAELYEDLIPLCRAHHEDLHRLYDASAEWRKLGRTQATSGIIAVLRRRQEGLRA